MTVDFAAFHVHIHDFIRTSKFRWPGVVPFQPGSGLESLRCLLLPPSATRFGRMLIRWKRTLFTGSYMFKTPSKGLHNPQNPHASTCSTFAVLVAIGCFTTDSAPPLGTEEQIHELDIFDYICTSRERWCYESAIASETGKTWWMKRECVEILLDCTLCTVHP